MIVIFVVIGALVVSAFSLVAIDNGNKASHQRGRDADAARYTAMARTYAALAAEDLSWPPRPDFSVLIEKHVIPVTGSAAGLAIYHQSEWAAQNGLDIYHQNERNSGPASAFHYSPSGR